MVTNNAGMVRDNAKQHRFNWGRVQAWRWPNIAGWGPFISHYRTMCLAPNSDFRRVLEDVRALRVTA